MRDVREIVLKKHFSFFMICTGLVFFGAIPTVVFAVLSDEAGLFFKLKLGLALIMAPTIIVVCLLKPFRYRLAIHTTEKTYVARSDLIDRQDQRKYAELAPWLADYCRQKGIPFRTNLPLP